MANDNGHGGRRTPANPAPVSGPGKYSRRTDGKQPIREMTGGSYGDAQAMRDIQAGAPMGATPSSAQAASAPPTIDPSALTPLDAPTGRPDEPVTEGVEQLTGAAGASDMDDATRERMRGYLPTLLWLASRPQASEQTRQFVRQLRADL